ncbi:MAG: hypoxanthine phosphoribosyltransferase [Arenicellales bacterium WSBS_2016_MAG_OTU3]
MNETTIRPHINRELLSKTQIARRINELAKQISADYKDQEPVLIGVLKGAFIVLADLARALSVPHTIEFIAVSTYEHGGQASDTVRLLMDVRRDLNNCHILLVEDIIDSGKTLAYLVDLLKARGASSVKTCVLVRKQREQVYAIEPDYLGFEIPDEWVVGYGLDYAEQYRTLSCVAAIDPVEK